MSKKGLVHIQCWANQVPYSVKERPGAHSVLGKPGTIQCQRKAWCTFSVGQTRYHIVSKKGLVHIQCWANQVPYSVKERPGAHSVLGKPGTI